jgi:putative sigma-54 modulation protein
MEFLIRGRNMEVSEGLRAAAQEKVGRLARHLEGWDSAEIHFIEERNPRIADKEVCEITLRGHGHILRAKAASPDAFASVDRVVGKLEHQLERLKSRQLQRSHPRRQSVDSADQAFSSDSDDDQGGSGRIVKTKRFDIKPMTPEEAALQMDLLNHGFYFFTNADTGAAAVVYKRGDGDVGLIDAS